ncbi:hypothetical protein POM88_028584 [Heracleum sosnowskyi]|uniref:Uncharacterized protein n=1 Tax=Heracleum sosnowskyi TaxID=360622 RepID=A0AAD8MGF5_9APIA|nr:hypothetical protein POM88_028584 [Heracleum sosnowskyi]
MRVKNKSCIYKSCTYGQPNFGVIDVNWDVVPVSVNLEVRDARGMPVDLLPRGTYFNCVGDWVVEATMTKKLKKHLQTISGNHDRTIFSVHLSSEGIIASGAADETICLFEENRDDLDYKVLSTAGAVLLVKLVTGSLAYNDIWFWFRTRYPWNIEEYSYGLSDGPAASTSVGIHLLCSHLKLQGKTYIVCSFSYISISR